ncbi:MAG: type IV pilus assembly protein PilM [Planctomycetota bacterium]
MILGRRKSILGLDIGDTTVKAVEITLQRDALTITGIGKAKVHNLEQLPSIIENLVRDSGIKSKRVVSAVSGRSVIIRPISMIEMGEAEMRQAIIYEADKYIPFEVDEVQLDCHRIEDQSSGGPGQMKVQLVAVKKSLIEDHTTIIEAAGLVPQIIDIDLFALGNAFELRNMLMGIPDDEVRALIDIGNVKTCVNVLRGQQSLFTREIYIAGKDFTEAISTRFNEEQAEVARMKEDPGGALESMQDAIQGVLDDLAAEIRLSFDFFEGQHEIAVKTVYLSGGSSLMAGMDNQLSQVLGLEVRLWDPTEGLALDGAALNSAAFSATNSEYAIAVGLASRIRGLS